MSSNHEQLARRSVPRRGLIWGGAGAAAAAAAANITLATPANAQGPRLVVYDVACLGDTFRVIWAPGAPDSGDLRGSTFSVEGALYPVGTIEGSGFDPDAHNGERIGTWLCRGWFILNPGRTEPHVVSTQEYVFGDIAPGHLFPKDQLASSGSEGSDAEVEAPVRSVIGGAGRFFAARGSVVQHGNGTNTTVLDGFGVPAPNFRFEFRLTKSH